MSKPVAALAQLTIFTAILINASPAQVPAEPSWHCGTYDSLAEYQVFRNGVRVNNVSVRERAAFGTKELRVLELSFSVANRSKKTTHVDAQLAGFGGDGKLIFAMKANPTFDLVAANETREATGSIYVNSGDLGRAQTLCFRVVGDF